VKKQKKQKIPKNIRNIVWDTYMGSDLKKGLCSCCNTETITFVNYHCGHIVSEKNGGSISIDNLIPICQSCNGSMGFMNMTDYKEKYGLK
jgi:5-methylcytosine-specific restriction endonuclease McrA